jgi:beta-glucosidase
MTGYGGCQFGNALREVLFGEAEPAGRLAYNIVESELDIADIVMNATSVVHGRFWGYLLLPREKKKDAYLFGFGLSYGDIVIQDLQVSSVLNDRFFDVQVKITNDGHRSSSGIVQIYAGKSSPSDDDDARVLVGFARADPLAPCDSAVVSVHCRLDPVARWNNATKHFAVSAGEYNIFDHVTRETRTFWSGRSPCSMWNGASMQARGPAENASHGAFSAL